MSLEDKAFAIGAAYSCFSGGFWNDGLAALYRADEATYKQLEKCNNAHEAKQLLERIYPKLTNKFNQQTSVWWRKF